MAGLSDLCFDPGVEFQKIVKARFGCRVSPTRPLSPKAFVLVASFGRSAIRLNVDSVGLILQSCLGGLAKDYNVIHLFGWMFGFLVFSKDVGFMIYRLRNYACKSLSIFFHLWSGGGPNWKRDFALWCKEEEAEWTMVGSKGKKT